VSVDFAIPGDPAAVLALAATTRSKGHSFLDVADALSRVSTEGWTGRAAELFREAHDAEPHRWREAGDGFLSAAQAFEAWADSLESAQAAAHWAETEYARGDAVTAQARASYDADVAGKRHEVANLAAQGIAVTLTILPFTDPGQPIRDAALAAFAAAQAELDRAAAHCADRLRAACAHAPEKRNWLESGLAFVAGIWIGTGEALLALIELGGTFTWKPLLDLIDVASGRMTAEELAMKHRLTREQAQALLDGMRADPLAFGKTVGKALLDWDTWADDPARAIGHLVPDVVATVATGGTGGVAVAGERAASATATIARHADYIADTTKLLRDHGLDGGQPAARIPRRFTSPDAHVAEAADAIEAAMPGRIISTNVDIDMKNGDRREVDIDLGPVVVQIKSDRARGLAAQMYKTEVSTGRIVIGFAPDMPPAAWSDAARKGVPIARSIDELIAILREIG